MELQDIDLKETIEKETGEKFNNKGYIKCPFHGEKTPSLSIKFHPDKNKYKFKCFGCDEGGDVIDFITKFKGIDYITARQYLSLSLEKTLKEELKEKVESFIEWEIGKYRAGQELLGIFTFVDSNNNVAYFKAKFLDHSDNKKKCGYYHIENEKVVTNRGIDEIPYNLYRTIEAIRNNKIIVICEGEKDCNTVNSVLKGTEYESTSIKCRFMF